MVNGIETEGDYEAYRKRVFDFLWREVEPRASEMERTGTFPQDELFPRFRELGLFAAVIPEEYGGIALTCTQYLPLLAEFSKVSGRRPGTAARPQHERARRRRLRHRGAEEGAAAGAGDRRAVAHLRHHRAQFRERYGCRHPCQARGRPLDRQRRQALHHQCGLRHGPPDLLPHRRAGRPPRAHRAGGAHRRARLHHRADARHDGQQRPAPRHPALQGHAGAGGQHGGRRRRRPRRLPRRTGAEPRLRRRQLAGDRRARVGDRPSLRRRAHHLRPAHRRPPVGAVRARGHGAGRLRAPPHPG